MSPRRIARGISDRIATNVFRTTRGVRVGDAFRLRGSPIVSLAPNSSFLAGDRVLIISDRRETALGVFHPTIIRTLLPGAKIIIGSDTGMSGGVICAAHYVEIGERCLIGANVSIFDTDFHPVAQIPRRYLGVESTTPKPVVIEDDVFLGTGCIITKGVTIGRGSVIGAGSVVSRDIPSFVIAAGNPCTVIRSISGAV